MKSWREVLNEITAITTNTTSDFCLLHVTNRRILGADISLQKHHKLCPQPSDQKKQYPSIWVKDRYACQRKNLHFLLKEDLHGITAGHLQSQECNEGFIKM